MVNMKIVDTLMYIAGIVLILYGFWMFKDFAIETFETTNSIFWKYKYDWITGIVMILLGLAGLNLVNNKNVRDILENEEKDE